jgi:hypothetical protein
MKSISRNEMKNVSYNKSCSNECIIVFHEKCNELDGIDKNYRKDSFCH